MTISRAIRWHLYGKLRVQLEYQRFSMFGTHASNSLLCATFFFMIDPTSTISHLTIPLQSLDNLFTIWLIWLRMTRCIWGICLLWSLIRNCLNKGYLQVVYMVTIDGHKCGVHTTIENTQPETHNKLKSSKASFVRCFFLSRQIMQSYGSCPLQSFRLIRRLWWMLRVNEMWLDIIYTHLVPSDVIWRYISGSTFGQIMACCLPTPTHYLI